MYYLRSEKEKMVAVLEKRRKRIALKMQSSIHEQVKQKKTIENKLSYKRKRNRETSVKKMRPVFEMNSIRFDLLIKFGSNRIVRFFNLQENLKV